MQPAVRATLTALEEAAATGAARNASALAPYVAGHLAGLVDNLLATPAPCVAVLSGFFIPHAPKPAAETDGPLGAALLICLFKALGWRAVGLSDTPCEPVLRAAFSFAGLSAQDMLFARPAGEDHPATPIEDVRAWLKAQGVTHLLSIERPGWASDGRAYNMRAVDISAHVYGFDPLFREPTCVTIGIGDGGNEVGMGAVPKSAITNAIASGEVIATVTPAHYALVCGVSNWGASLLGAGLAAAAPSTLPMFRSVFTDDAQRACLAAMLAAGAVDGVTREAAPTIDGMALETHLAKHHELDTLLTSR